MSGGLCPVTVLDDSPETNNSLEGWPVSCTAITPRLQPPIQMLQIYKLIEVLKLDQSNTDNKIVRLVAWQRDARRHTKL